MMRMHELTQALKHCQIAARRGTLYLELYDCFAVLATHPVTEPNRVPQGLVDAGNPSVLHDWLANYPYVDTPVYDWELISLALAHLGNPIPYERERGAFAFLHTLIKDDIISASDLKQLCRLLVTNDYLFTGLFSAENPAVFRRSYNLLVLVDVLQACQRRELLSATQLQYVTRQVALYALRERDTRGFVVRAGWAHAWTHLSNVAECLFQDSQISRGDKLVLLGSLLAGYTAVETPFTMGENDRLVQVVGSLTQEHPLYSDYVLRVLKRWRQDLATQGPPSDVVRWHQMYNRQRFFQSVIVAGVPAVPEEIVTYVAEAPSYFL